VGEGIVSSQVVTDSYLVDGREMTIAGRTIRHKPLRTECLSSGGTRISATPPEMADHPTLTDGQAISLAGYAQAIRAGGGTFFLDRDLDIEWALLGGNIVILQARPITVADARAAQVVFADTEEEDPSMRDNVLYSRMDTGEIVTGLMTPLGLSFCRFYQRAIHGPAVKTIGLRKLMPARHFMGYIRGYVYLNISASAYLLTQCPPTRNAMKFTRRYADDQRILDDYRNPYGETMRGSDHLMGGLYWIGRQMVNLATAERTARRMETLRRERTDRFLALDLEALSLPELDAELSLIDRHFRESCAAYMPFFLQSFALYDALAELCEKWLGAYGNGLQNRIKASLNNLRTIEVTAGVVALADEVRGNAELNAVFLETPSVELADRLRIHPVGRVFWEGPFHQFLRQFGARGRQEFELTIPRWNDDPSYLLNVIRLYLRNDVDLQEKMRQSDALREEETRRLFAALPLRARVQLRLVIAGYARMARLRERIRPTFIAETWCYRRSVMEVMRRLCAAGAVRPADIPFIDFDEFRGYVAGRKTAGQAFARDMIEKNRRDHLVNLRGDEPPMSIVGGWVPARTKPLSGEGGDADILTGVGASPGIVVARARVITDLQREAGEFQKGEILVAKYTDASWTPLFLLASGIVADIGSTLSHSSIVSREFGIPAVVNTRTATQSIRTGDCLYLDGDAGLVRIEERAGRQDAA
ncbi:MAG: phosphoenolpyruvate synthase, partial [Methanobacterium sp.]|nr:phosphoenolpyruvate synthase [Methanobacterium sp.]